MRGGDLVNTDSEPPVPLDPEWWLNPEVRPALAAQDLQWVYGWLQRRGWSQARIAASAGQSQPEVSAVLHGRQVQAYAVLIRVADGFGIPRGHMGLSHCRCPECSHPGAQPGGRGEGEGGDPMERRLFITAVESRGG
jgi:transcriptional regulator with XRE-family HTH domain